MNPVYIISATQISAQEPLSEAWMLAPKKLASGAAPCLDPDFKEFIPPVQARRMGNLLKRALVTAKKALALSGIPMPDAILCGTGLGCMVPTERILATFQESGEGSVSPTDFMQSTHNTIASTIAIHLKCHGYNCTYSQGSVSFESALLDAFLQLKAGLLSSALVCAGEENRSGTGRLRKFRRTPCSGIQTINPCSESVPFPRRRACIWAPICWTGSPCRCLAREGKIIPAFSFNPYEPDKNQE